MATKNELRGAFGSLSDTLLWRFDPSANQEVREKWLGVIAQHASVARSTSKWRALAPECPAYETSISELNTATTSVVAADSDPERLVALNVASSAIEQTRQVINDNPCASNLT